MKQLFLFLTISFLLASCGNSNKVETQTTDTIAGPIEPVVAPKTDSIIAFINTSKGMIICDLEFEKTPLTVANFIGLAEGAIKNNFKGKGKPFYDGLIFHRVIHNFMIQGGDPMGNGSGGPGYTFADEFHPTLKHDGAGYLSMANSGPRTNGSQFFITHTATPWLDGKHSIFGKVIKGQEIVDAIAQNDVIISITFKRIGEKAKAFDAKTVFENEMEKKSQISQTIPQFETWVKKNYPDAVKYGYMYILETQKGSGQKPMKGQTIVAHYTGTLTDGTKFDSSLDRGTPLEFQVGTGQVIKGWDDGFMNLSAGSRAKLIIPYTLAYGERGQEPTIPPMATLIFDVELILIK